MVLFNMHKILFKCPICGERVTLELSDDIISEIEDHIRKHGKSPVYSVVCPKKHQLMALLSVKEQKNNKIVYVREVITTKTLNSTKDKTESSSTLDWVTRHFG